MSLQCIFRNRSRLGHQLDSRKKTAAGITQGLQRLEASKTATYCRESLCEFPVDAAFLQDTLVDDLNCNRICEDRFSTLTTLSHREQSLVVFASGRFMDQLVVRDLNSFSTKDPVGFSISLGRGESLVEILQAGKCDWNESSIILSRTRAEIFSLKTVNIDDFTGQGTEGSSMTVILEPLQKWQLPREIVSMSTFPGSSLSLATSVTKEGQLYTWNPVDGIVAFSSPSTIFPSWSDINNVSSVGLPIVNYSSFHPMILFATIGCDVNIVDLRQNSPADSLLTLNASCSSLCQPDLEGRLMVVGSHDAKLSLFDIRYPKHFLLQRSYLGEVHCSIKTSTTTNSKVLLLGGTIENSMLVHSIDFGETAQRKANEPISRFLSSYQPSSDLSCFWETTYVPFLEASTPNVSLYGAELVPIERFADEPQSEEGVLYKDSKSHFMLFYQSSIGDVLSQPIVLQGGKNSPMMIQSSSATSSSRVVLEDTTKKTTFSRKGTELESSLFVSDQRIDVLPLSSNTLAVVSEVSTNPKTNDFFLSGTVPRFLGGIPRDDKPQDVFSFLDGALKKCWPLMRASPMSLSEVWSFVASNNRVDVDATALRQYLRESPQSFREVLVPIPCCHSGWTSDGMQVTIKTPSEALMATTFPLVSTCCECSSSSLANDDIPCAQYRICPYMHALVYSHNKISQAHFRQGSSSSEICAGVVESDVVSESLNNSILAKWK